MPTRPEDVINRALDECGISSIGALTPGTVAANAALRIYDATLREVLTAAHWNFARVDQSLALIGDATARYADNISVPAPWNYMYEWPIDCLLIRYIPIERVTGIDAAGLPIGQRAVSLGTTPYEVGTAPLPNDTASSWSEVEGHDPESTRVIYTNQLGARLIYTGIKPYPDAWEPLFLNAFVYTLAARLAMPLHEDKRLAMAIRQDNFVLAKQALDIARVRNANEGFVPLDFTPDWMLARTGCARLLPFYQPWLPLVEETI